jgi:hypothetical protein
LIVEKVENISDKTASVGRLNSDVLIDNTGRQYSSDYGAASTIPSEYSSTGTLQPGSWAPFAEAYDVPVGTTPTAVVMHGDLFTPGVRISVNDFSPTPIDLSHHHR